MMLLCIYMRQKALYSLSSAPKRSALVPFDIILFTRALPSS